ASVATATRSTPPPSVPSSATCSPIGGRESNGRGTSSTPSSPATTAETVEALRDDDGDVAAGDLAEGVAGGSARRCDAAARVAFARRHDRGAAGDERQPA